MEVKASLKYARIGTQKARLVVDLVRGQNVNDAIRMLTYTPRKGARLLKKLIESAVANAEFKKTIDVDNLYVETVTADEGPSMKRYLPRAQGRATLIRKKTTHFNVILKER